MQLGFAPSEIESGKKLSDSDDIPSVTTMPSIDTDYGVSKQLPCASIGNTPDAHTSIGTIRKGFDMDQHRHAVTSNAARSDFEGPLSPSRAATIQRVESLRKGFVFDDIEPSLSPTTTGIPAPLSLADCVDVLTSTNASGRASALLLRRLGVVVPGVLYVSSYREACDVAVTESAGIQAYLCVARDVNPALPAHVSETEVVNGDIAFLHVPVDDAADTRLEEHFNTIFNFIDAQEAAGRPVLLYCQQGKSRSVAFAVAYLMQRLGFSPEEALMEIRVGYNRADPNVFFLAQLHNWNPVPAVAQH
jgi:protein tyrosine phosphatase (PTP) superfamily phosphohydrolase (DUF442 family)